MACLKFEIGYWVCWLLKALFIFAALWLWLGELRAQRLRAVPPAAAEWAGLRGRWSPF
jgi:hypothetical protein